jgi:hypothetical protein
MLRVAITVLAIFVSSFAFAHTLDEVKSGMGAGKFILIQVAPSQTLVSGSLGTTVPKEVAWYIEGVNFYATVEGLCQPSTVKPVVDGSKVYCFTK